MSFHIAIFQERDDSIPPFLVVRINVVIDGDPFQIIHNGMTREGHGKKEKILLGLLEGLRQIKNHLEPLMIRSYLFSKQNGVDIFNQLHTSLVRSR